MATQPASDRGSRDTALRHGGAGCRGRLTDHDNPHPARSRRESVINAVMWPAESRTEDSGDRGEVFGLAAGTELLGEDHSGGFQQPRYLVRRGDGQIAQLPRVLYLVAAATDGQRGQQAVAERVQSALGQLISAEQVDFLIRDRLLPAGIVDVNHAQAVSTTGEGARTSQRSDHLLTLRHRKAVVPAAAVWIIAGVFQSLHRPSVMIVGLVVFGCVDTLLLTRLGPGELLGSAQHLVARPALTLLVVALILVAGMFHECGHVTACRYSGATPGAMGVGLYLVWPAFYSDVTDAYRLGRAGRLRTDLGGVYFNALALAGLGGWYLATGWPWLLAALTVLHLDTVWQFLPSLRFDGYYILADLVGVPDLFNRIRPILTSLLSRRPTPDRVTELKPWVRRVVSVWVALVIPFLACALVLLLTTLVHLLPVVGNSLGELLTQAQHALGSGHPAAGVLAVGRAAMLLLPVAGGTIVLLNLLRRIIGSATAPLLRGRGAPAARALHSAHIGRVVLAGCGVALLLRLGFATHGDIVVLLTVMTVTVALLTVVAVLEVPTALPILTVTAAAMNSAPLASLTTVPPAAPLLTAVQALTLCGLALPVRTGRTWPVLRTLPPFAIGLGITVVPLVSALTATLAVPIAVRAHRHGDRSRGRTGRHRRTNRHNDPRQNGSWTNRRDSRPDAYHHT